jgi:hypothetical protein
MSKRRNEDDMDISDNEGTSQQNDQPLNEVKFMLNLLIN